jgi:hypothetical protein
MISFNQLGAKGWLGNQMFQYASLRGIASSNEYEFCIPPNDSTRIHNYSLMECFNLDGCKNITYLNANRCLIEFGFHEALLHSCPDNIDIEGFLQSEKYFIHIKEKIRKDFQFKEKHAKKASEKMSFFEEKPIFLHVRRSDYVSSQDFHCLLSENYYMRALSYFDKNCDVLIFSDDIDWCKKQDIFSGDRFYFSDSFERFSTSVAGHIQPALLPFVDLCMMTLCSGAIIANSTFSWWGAWLMLESDKKIIAPKQWFGPALSHLDIRDLIPEAWIKI